MKPLGIKGGAQKEPCFLLLLSAPVRNGVGCFFFFFGCFLFCCRFMRSRSPPPPRLLCSTTETPGGPWRRSSVRVGSGTGSPELFLSYSLKPTRRPRSLSPETLPNQILLVNAPAITRARRTALEDQIRAGLGKIKSLLSLNLQVPNYTAQLSPISQTSESLPQGQ